METIPAVGRGERMKLEIRGKAGAKEGWSGLRTSRSAHHESTRRNTNETGAGAGSFTPVGRRSEVGVPEAGP